MVGPKMETEFEKSVFRPSAVTYHIFSWHRQVCVYLKVSFSQVVVGKVQVHVVVVIVTGSGCNNLVFLVHLIDTIHCNAWLSICTILYHLVVFPDAGRIGHNHLWRRLRWRLLRLFRQICSVGNGHGLRVDWHHALAVGDHGCGHVHRVRSRARHLLDELLLIAIRNISGMNEAVGAE